MKYVLLQTGLGTNSQSTSYYGPFEDQPGSTDAFIARVREAMARLKDPSDIGMVVMDSIPAKYSATNPEHFRGFIAL